MIGPRGWPIIGFIPKISSLENGKQVNLYESMWKLSDIFKSNVLGFFIGPNSQPFICVNGPEAVREALHNNDLNGRADTPFIRGRTFGLGIGKLKIIHHVLYDYITDLWCRNWMVERRIVD